MIKLLILLTLLFTALPSEAVVNLTWDPPCGEAFNFTTYQIYRKLAGETDYKLLGTSSGLTRFFQDLNHPTSGTGSYLVAQWGPTTLGDQAASNILQVTYNGPANTPPTITPIPDQVVAEDTPGSVTFTIGDAETPVQMLNVTANSSNSTVVAVSGLVFTGMSPNLTLTVTPVLNASGSTVITITVSDGQLTTDEVFMFMATAVNDPPTISSVANQTVTTNTTIGPLTFTVADVDTSVSTLTVTGTSSNTTLIPNGNIALGGADANRTVTLTPASNQTGTSTITLTVSDGALTASTQFNVTVNPANPLTWSAGIASWNSVPNPHQQDWVGMFTIGAQNTAYFSNWFYTSTCQQFSQQPPVASGSCPMPIPAGTPSGTQLEIRLFLGNSFTILYTSAPFTAP